MVSRVLEVSLVASFRNATGATTDAAKFLLQSVYLCSAPGVVRDKEGGDKEDEKQPETLVRTPVCGVLRHAGHRA